MKIPRSSLEKFVKEVVTECQVSQVDRITRGEFYKNYFLYGGENAESAAMYNKTFAYIDDLESLLYSPVNLRFHLGDPDMPSILEQAKGRAAAAKLRQMVRKSDTDTMISSAVGGSLVEGKTFIKQSFKGGMLCPEFVRPGAMGVMRESHDKLDENMEAFTHSFLITPYQLHRLVANHPDRETILRKAKRYTISGLDGLQEAGANKQVIVGGLYPFQPAGSPTPNTTRGIVDWMASPNPTLAPNVAASMLRMDEVWIWDDDRSDWATFQLIGDDLLIFGKYQIVNAMAHNTDSQQSAPELKGKHPFSEFTPNPTPGYFWARSEIPLVMSLQEAINSRLNGINRLLRKQEDPPKHFSGSTGVNQNALAKFNKPGGYWSDANSNAKITEMPPSIQADLWASLHEYERMFDDLGGLPPIARGRGEAGVRSQGHAETLVRMFSPRFKDRALLVERDVEALGGLMLDLAKAHVDKKMYAWVPEASAAGQNADKSPLIEPPAPGMVPVLFTFAGLDDDLTLTVDSHSSSPAFLADAKALVFDLFKIGAMDPVDVINAVDAPNPEELVAGVERRSAQKQAQIAELAKTDPHGAQKLLEGGGKKH